MAILHEPTRQAIVSAQPDGLSLAPALHVSDLYSAGGRADVTPCWVGLCSTAFGIVCT